MKWPDLCYPGRMESEVVLNGKKGQADADAVKYDQRHPLYNGFWKRSQPNLHPPLFASDNMDEPHVKRKLTILAKYPQITLLYGIEPSTKYISVCIVAIQLLLAYLFQQVNFTGSISAWVAMVTTAFFIGGTVTQIVGVILHEAAHCLCFESSLHNKLLSMFVNIPLPIPIGLSFRRYHLDHHAFQGVEGHDPDLPMDWELKMIRGNALLKTVWLLIYPVMYIVRAASFGKDVSFWERVNIACTLLTDAAVIYGMGWKAFGYLLLSTWFGYGIHPAAAHFIQEHYTWESGQETYSYYGDLNWLFLNIGYHNEHHDFTQVPWSKLPLVTSIAPEFYLPLKSHPSWVMVYWEFITKPCLGPQSRVSRDMDSHKTGRKQISAAALNNKNI